MSIYEGAAGVQVTEKNLISLSQLADGARIKECLDKVESLSSSSSSFNPNLYRLKNVKIGTSDLDPEVLEMISNHYNDTGLKNKIGILESLLNEKADRCDLSLYRRTTELISQYDLDDELIKIIKSGDYDYIYDDTEIRKQIKTLFDCKTETAESGFIYDLDPTFAEIVKEMYGQVTMVNCLNFLFNFIQFYKTEDLGLITDKVIEVKDYRLVTNNIDEELSKNYGILEPEENNV